MRTPTRLAIGLLAATALLATGCSDDDGDSGASTEVSAEAQPFVDAMKESMASSEDDTFNLTDGQIDCVSPRLINAIGVDRLEAAGVTPEDIASDDDSMDFSDLDLSEDDGGRMYDAFGDCDVDFRQVMLDGMAEGGGMSDEATECVEGVLTDDAMRTFVVSMIVNGEDGMESDPAMEGLMSELMACAMADMGG